MSEPQQHQHVFVCVDPNPTDGVEGGRESRFTVVTMSDTGDVILGGDSFPAYSREDYDQRLVRHIHLVRCIPCYETATIVLDIESGTGLEAGHIDTLVRDRFDKVITMTDFCRKAGTRTNPRSKQERSALTHNLIKLNGGFRLHRGFITTAEIPHQFLLQFTEQLTRVEEPMPEDDLVHTLQRCVRARHRFIEQTLVGMMHHHHL
jgi:hypothetical protein